MQKKYLGINLLTTSVLTAYMTTATATQPNVSLEDILMDKGIITKEEWLKIKEGQNYKNEEAEKIVGKKVDAKVAEKIESDFPVKADWGKKGFRLETRDGNWATNLQWRAQMRYTSPYRGDPRQVDDFTGTDESTFELRRVRMKIGGHGYRPWLKYYFEVDLQPTRDSDDSSTGSSSRLFDWRITANKYKWATLRVGQWKINYNRERVDSSGRQQFVERSIVNRIFTVDRQMGVQLRGHLFPGSAADMRYYAGAFTGEGLGVSNDDDNLMSMGRLQWNFFGRDLKWRQTDVEYHEQPAGSIAFAAATNLGRCTRWSSSGCGSLDGFTAPAAASNGQFKVEQIMQEFAFKWRGLSIQEEFHWKTVEDRVTDTRSHFRGSYAQAGYFFHDLIPIVPKPLELAFRYAFVEEPNELDISRENTREEYTAALNWFFAGHNNKLTLDVSHLSLEDTVLARNVDGQRVRFQWDVSF